MIYENISPRIPLLVPQLPDAEQLLPYLRRIDQGKWYSNFGPLVRELEAKLEVNFQAANPQGAHVTTFSNCTAGLELVLTALELPPKSKVLIPALTFVGTATAVVKAGLIPVATDIDAATWQMTPAIARDAIGRNRAAAVMPVATFGCPLDTDAWDSVARDTGVPVVIDAAAAYGNQWSCGDATLVFSMHATKVLAAGEGGFAVTRSTALAKKLRRLTNFGINLGDCPDVPLGLVTLAGSNAKMSEYHAAVGLASLDRFHDDAAGRIELARRYMRIVDSHLAEKVTWQEFSNGVIRSTMCAIFNLEADRTKAIAALMRSGIAVRTWYCPLIPEHTGFAGTADSTGVGTAKHVAGRLLGLPFYATLTDGDIEEIAVIIKQALS